MGIEILQASKVFSGDVKKVIEGAKPVHGGWVRSSGWSFNCGRDLTNYLESVFKGFKFQKHHGSVDRQREIMTFVKEPAMVAGEVCN